MKSILIDEALHKQLKMYCAKNEYSMNAVVEGAIRNTISQTAAGTKIELVTPGETPTIQSIKFSPVPKPGKK